MPNLIHTLDATSLSLLYAEFISHFSHEKMHTQFFSIHDCFATTCEKVFVLKTIYHLYIQTYIQAILTKVW